MKLSKPTVDVTVIMPTFNRELFIESALRSIYNQSVQPSQVIVVNDGSTDGTASIVRQFDPTIQLISKPNGGKSTALNLGLSHAVGKYVWIFDDDDIAAPNALELMHDALDRDAEAGFAFGAYSKFLTQNEAWLYQSPPRLNDVTAGNLYLNALALYPGLMVRNFIMQPGMLVRKRCYDEVGPFNEQLVRSQDYEMLLRLARGNKGLPIADVVFHQRQHVGRRGSLANPVETKNIYDSWISYDQSIFRAIHASHELSEFLPDSMRHDLSNGEMATAHFVRGCIMGRHQLWDLAAEDFKTACSLCASVDRTALNVIERFVIRHLLDIWNFAPERILGCSAFYTVLQQIPNRRFREEIRSALLFPLPYVIRTYLKSRSRADALAIVQTYLAFATPRSIAHSLMDKIQAKLRHHASADPVGIAKEM